MTRTVLGATGLALLLLAPALQAQDQDTTVKIHQGAPDAPPPSAKGTVKKSGKHKGSGGDVGSTRLFSPVTPKTPSRSIVSQLEHFRTKIDKLERLSRTENVQTQEAVQSSVGELREKTTDALSQARQLRTTTGSKATEMRDGLQNSLDDLDARYHDAVGKLSQHNQQQLEQP